MSTHPIRCVGTAYLHSPRPIPPLSLVADSHPLTDVTDAEFAPEPLKDIEYYSRPTHFAGVSKSRSLLDVAQKDSDATTFAELWLSTISESSCSDAETLSEGPTDGSSMASTDSLDEICSPATPPSPNLPPFSPVVDQECHCMWSPEERLHPHSASGVTFTALGFVCPDLEPMPESLQDFRGQYSNDGDKSLGRNALVMNCCVSIAALAESRASGGGGDNSDVK